MIDRLEDFSHKVNIIMSSVIIGIDPILIIDWCRDKFEWESYLSYPQMVSSQQSSRWVYRTMSKGPSLDFYFKDIDDCVLFKMTWL